MMNSESIQKPDSCLQDEQHFDGYIGVFDSGVGGISVLHELVRQLPEEDFLYFGDSAHAPYGEKTIEEIRALTLQNVNALVGRGVKALVIACNTATSAAIRLIRDRYEARMPVIGVEPALKPAAEAFPSGRILVMATPATLKLDKYAKLSKQLSREAEFIPVPCQGLAGRIEKGSLDAPDMETMLQSLLGPYIGHIDAIVLGCTHYPFIRRQIRQVMGDIPLFDGGAGTARQLHRCLQARNLLKETARKTASETYAPGQIIFSSSRNTPDELALYRRMYESEL